MKDRIKIEIIKNAEGYTIGEFNEKDEPVRMHIFSDNDLGRTAIVQYLVNEILNAPVKGSKKYI